ncbi:MAG: hypothetical protein AAF403_02215 [Pseudomonadota bacterium]
MSNKWLSPEEFGASLKNFGFNLLTRDITREVEFSTEVLGAKKLYGDDDFAALTCNNMTWMLHHDRTYRNHPLSGFVKTTDTRGAGIELHLYHRNPDQAEALARQRDDIILARAMDKPHGLREVYILSPEGYVWVLSQPINHDNA